uniref:Uncharacterized protein n=1 Tax=Mus spicilegus TaxID=10103 RepID=A0A8C6III5_MUSSI
MTNGETPGYESLALNEHLSPTKPTSGQVPILKARPTAVETQRSPLQPPPLREPLLRHRDTSSHVGVPLPARPSALPPVLTRGRRATLCWTRSFTARSANPTPSSAVMLPPLNIPQRMPGGPATHRDHLPVPPPS